MAALDRALAVPPRASAASVQRSQFASVTLDVPSAPTRRKSRRRTPAQVRWSAMGASFLSRVGDDVLEADSGAGRGSNERAWSAAPARATVGPRQVSD